MKVSKKYYSLVFAALVSLTMSVFMSFALTLVNTGYDERFWLRWLTAYPVSFLVSLPISFIFVPIIKKVTDKLTST